MIRYGLTCDGGHGFEAWFRSSADFDAQAERNLLSCPVCGDPRVTKAIMAPAIATGAARREPAGETPASPAVAPTSGLPAPAGPSPAGPSGGAGEVALLSDRERALRSALNDIRRAVMERSEDVGDRFPELARKMHAEEIEQRSIRGRATVEEARALVEEGVAIQPLPHFPDDVN